MGHSPPWEQISGQTTSNVPSRARIHSDGQTNKKRTGPGPVLPPVLLALLEFYPVADINGVYALYDQRRGSLLSRFHNHERPHHLGRQFIDSSVHILLIGDDLTGNVEQIARLNP